MPFPMSFSPIGKLCIVFRKARPKGVNCMKKSSLCYSVYAWPLLQATNGRFSLPPNCDRFIPFLFVLDGRSHRDFLRGRCPIRRRIRNRKPVSSEKIALSAEVSSQSPLPSAESKAKPVVSASMSESDVVLEPFSVSPPAE